MSDLIYCEIRKMVKSGVFKVVTIAFALLPFLSLIKFTAGAGVRWEKYLADTLTPFSAFLIIGFAFTSCWIFGREYTDNTIKDLLVKPISKLTIAVSKFITIVLWNSLLTVIMFAVVALIGAYAGMTNYRASVVTHYFLMFMAVSLLTMICGTVSAFLANWTKGYLAPIGFIFLIVVLANVVENLNLAAYIPWTIPGLLLSDGGFGVVSTLILLITGAAGFVGTVAVWRYKEI